MSKTAYATPVDDQDSWRQADHSHLLPAHLVAFLQGGVSVTLCARSVAGRPVIGVGVACRVRDMAELRVLLSQGANLPLVEAVRHGSALAATFTRARDHRSIQLKTLRARLGDAAPDDHGEAARQSAILAEELMELGYTRLQAEAYAGCHATDLISLVFRPERVFTQTPGPGAGAELER
ncbi:hypothetical protein E0K89_016690 [Aquicoccus sp. SCR17]|nr:hypothetical protein [Carideicomes alvinocaridis]